MNLPDYLSPAPPFYLSELADHKLELIQNVRLERDENLEARCSCGWKNKVPYDDLRAMIVFTWRGALLEQLNIHAGELYVEARWKAKWNAVPSPIQV
jgi:hypothetical protein